MEEPQDEPRLHVVGGDTPEPEPERLEQQEEPDAAMGIPLPQMSIPLTGASVRVADGENGERAIIVGPLLINFVLPLTADGCRVVATGLTGGIEIAGAHQLPPKPSTG